MDGSAAYNTVFIDTSLDTHLALMVSDVDTVSDLKKKIMHEHPICFPNFGEIKVHALKVKRKGYFYHLTDHMCVKSAFDGVKKNWFLSIDASSLIKRDKSKLSSEPVSSSALLCITNGPLADGVDLLPDGTSKKLSITDDLKLQEFESDHFLNQKVPMADHFGPDASIGEVLKDLEMEVKHVSGDHCKTSSSDSSQKLDSGIQEKCDLISKGNEMLGRLIKGKKDNSSNGISDLQCIVPLAESIQNGAASKKKSKTKRKFEALVESCALKVNDGYVDASSKDVLEQETTVPDNAENACIRILDDSEMGNKHIRDEPDSAEWTPTKVMGMHERDDDRLKEKKVANVHPNVSFGEASEAGTTAKKKRKIEKKSKDPVNDKEALICNSSKETSKPENIIPGNAMYSKQETTTITNDSLPTGPPQDNNLICDNSNSEKKKKKKKKSKKKQSSSYNAVEAAVAFSMEDVREESSRGTLGKSQKDSGKEPDEAVAHVQNVQDAMRSEPCSIYPRETHIVTVQEVGAVHAVLSHEPRKSAGRGKKSNKTKNSNGEMQVTSGIGHANSFVSGITSIEPLTTVDGGHLDKIAEHRKNVPSQTARTEVAEIDTVNTLKLGAGKEAHEMHGNVEESVQPMQAGKTEEIQVNPDVKGRKKSRKKIASSSVENLPYMQMKEQDGHSTLSTEKTKEADVPSKKKNKPDVVVETGSENPINESNLQSEKNTGSKSESLQCQIGVDVDSTSGRANETIKRIGDSISQGDVIKFSDYFLPSQQPHEAAGSAEALVDKVIEAKRSERKVEAKKNLEKVDQRSVALRSNDNHGSETDSGVGNSSSIQGSLRKDKSDKLLPGSKKRSSKVSENKMEAQRSLSRPNTVKASVTTTPARANVNEIDKASTALSSSSEISIHKFKSQTNQKPMTARKASGDNSGNKSSRGKSLLAISGSIFKDDDDDSSEDDGFVDSDASTRTPSNDSSSSDYSEVENKAGSHGSKRKVDGGNSSGLKNMTLDAILKSSSRFKKAKITASQYEDIESQPVDFVPDSQANL